MNLSKGTLFPSETNEEVTDMNPSTVPVLPQSDLLTPNKLAAIWKPQGVNKSLYGGNLTESWWEFRHLCRLGLNWTYYEEFC